MIASVASRFPTPRIAGIIAALICCVPCSPAPAPAADVTVCVNELPRGSCGLTPFFARLDPLGLESGMVLESSYVFADLPPGQYVLTVAPRCSFFGCRPPVVITVEEEDLFVPVDLVPMCRGDCNVDCVVEIPELVAGVEQALLVASQGSCLAFDDDLDTTTTVDEIILGVRNYFTPCLGSGPPLCALQ